MDFLSALPEEIFDEIATYFNGNDVLESSLVCKSWYQLFGQSKTCMKTLTAKYCNVNRRQNLNVLLSSNRKYQNIKLEFQSTYYLRGSKIEENIRAILKKFAGTIVTLNTSHDFQRICNLPKLKELQFNNSNWNYYNKNTNYFYSNGLLSKSTHLRSLSILSPRNLDETSIKIIQKSLAGMRFLKSLRVNQGGIFENLKSDDCHFKLEKFDIDTYINFGINFIKNHQSTLKIMRIDRAQLEDISLILSSFPKLHTFCIRNLAFQDSKQPIEFPQNTTIKTLIIKSYWLHLNLAKIIMKLKGLQQLKLSMLSWRTYCAATHCPALQTIEYRILDASLTDEQKTRIESNCRFQFIKRPKNHVY